MAHSAFPQRITGFALELEGPEEDLRSILGAAFAEMARLRDERPPLEVFSNFGPGRYLHPALTVRGTVSYKTEIGSQS